MEISSENKIQNGQVGVHHIKRLVHILKTNKRVNCLQLEREGFARGFIFRIDTLKLKKVGKRKITQSTSEQ